MTDIAIGNRALQKLAAGSITALSDGSVLGDAVGLVYSDTRDFVLSQANWNFAIKRVVLTALSSVPSWGFAAEYTLPADSIRVVKIEDARPDDWSVEDGKILSKQGTTINVLYIYRNVDTTTYSQVFIEALSARIALELTEHLVQSRTKKETMAAEYNDAIRVARQINKLEGTPNLLDDGSWLDSRV